MTLFATLSLKHGAQDATLFAKQLGDNLLEWGFCGIKDHNIDQKLTQEVLQIFVEFFALPVEKKMQYFNPDLNGSRGYTPMKVEKAKDSAYPDIKEFWHIGRELEITHPFSKWMHKNLYVSEINQFKEKTSTLYMQFDQLGQTLLNSIAIYLGIDEQYFSRNAELGNSIMRAIHYPPITQKDRAERAGAHEDINLITLLIGGHQSGLEILSKNNTWKKVKVGRDVIICNIGDMLQRFTNHYLPSTTHRVSTTKTESKSSRYSIPFFVHSNPDWLIETLETCITDNHPNKYPKSILAEDYLGERLEEINLA
jgi:isopenicillin N synthase-like dioxygenase